MFTHSYASVLLFLVLAVNSDRFQSFTELHALAQAARPYVLLVPAIAVGKV